MCPRPLSGEAGESQTGSINEEKEEHDSTLKNAGHWRLCAASMHRTPPASLSICRENNDKDGGRPRRDGTHPKVETEDGFRDKTLLDQVVEGRGDLAHGDGVEA